METIESRYGPVSAGIVPANAGAYMGFDDYGGISGGNDYQRSQNVSLMARFAPDTLKREVRKQFDEPWLSEISPRKPAAVGLVGTDVFGGPSFKTTTRNSILWWAGEAASTPTMNPAEMPTGASEVGWAEYAEKPNPASVCGMCQSQFQGASPLKPGQYGTYGNAAPRKKALTATLHPSWFARNPYII
jgi:hypothetical protein